jgi:hypothetical protein
MFDKRENVREILRSLIRLVIILVVLWLTRTFLLVLPPIPLQIPNIPITFSIIANVVLGGLMMFVLLKFGREISHPTEILLESSLELRTIIMNLIYLVAIGIAYLSFHPLIRGIVPEYMWIYSVASLIIAFFPIIRVALAFYRSIDKWTDSLAKRLIKPEFEYGERPVTCSACGASLAFNAAYCANCGAKVK